MSGYHAGSLLCEPDTRTLDLLHIMKALLARSRDAISASSLVRRPAPGGSCPELIAARYEWLELGPYGYLPTDPGQLADEVGKRGLRVSGGTVFGALHRPQEWDEMLATTRQVAELTGAPQRSAPSAS